jgi:hypothetical protein
VGLPFAGQLAEAVVFPGDLVHGGARGGDAIPRRDRRQAAEGVVGRVDPADGAVHARAEQRGGGGRLAAQDYACPFPGLPGFSGLLSPFPPVVKDYACPFSWSLLLRHCGGFVPPLFSPNIIDNATHQCASNIQPWNIIQGSTGLDAFLLRSRLLSGGFSALQKHFALSYVAIPSHIARRNEGLYPPKELSPTRGYCFDE